MGSMSSFSGGANQFSRSRNGQNGQFGQNRNGFGAAQSVGTYTSRAVRPQQKVAFQHPIRPVEQIGSSVTATYVRTGNPSFKGLDVAINGEGTMTLKGEVPDADAMALAIAMARLEPGVRNVDNQLTVPNQTYNPGTTPVNQRNP
jgi:osmotically-inducible protein OsmY